MENTKKKPNKSKRRKSNCFLTCFGLSFEPVLEGENPSKMVISITPTKEKIISSSSSNNMTKKKKKNLIRWFSSSSGLDTVPVDPSPASSEKLPGGENPPAASSTGDSEHKRNRSTRKSSSSNGDVPEGRGSPEITSAEDPDENPIGQTSHGSPNSIILGCGKQTSHVEAGKLATWQKRQSFVRKIDAIRAPKSQPGSPEIKPKSNRTAPNRSTSLSVTSNDKLADKPMVKPGTAIERPGKETDSSICDSVIGMSIMLVTLLIFSLWGRLCAVICTCAWLYFVPLLKAMVGQDGIVKSGSVRYEPNFDSAGYKKRVVLEGFLERRNQSGL